ncbi:MFS transporter [Streptacidiphilus sp. ASG 303]|uniref:MFS transporter n=1 Tax=Streptacidiphilus sp. ASG 303 TaxID=2896847 RepID=UPI001E524592|nr:MFS transporter [Streptacidiphilus sp. ASG 303]MCD0481110.1 MFS transporter [Streptacidiphilus sp. ASG 303]
MRRLARRLYAHAFAEDFVPLYPLYALLFTGHGLSDAQVSSLFALWSATSVLLEVPTGLWADSSSRRRLLTVAPLPVAAAWALWTFAPCYASFAAGFVLWGVGGALRSGALQALVYEELVRLGEAGAYARLTGRSQAVGTTAVVAATALAGPLLSVGGYPAVGAVSIAATLLAVPVARSLPESRDRPGPGGGAEPDGRAGPGDGAEPDGRAAEAGRASGVLRAGLAEVRRAPVVRRRLLLLAGLLGLGALDEYVPLVAGATGAGPSTVPLLVLLVTAGTAAGGWLADRGGGRAAGVLAVAAVCLAEGAASGRPAGTALVAVAFGALQWAQAAAEARLQDAVGDGARATVSSLAGVGSEAASVLLYGAWALGSAWAPPGVLLALAAGPFLAAALSLRRSR